MSKALASELAPAELPFLKALDDDDIPTGVDRFNVLNHGLVPHHELVPVEDEAAMLSPWGLEVQDISGEGTRLAKELLPKILITDPRSKF